jgi:hypothetical protein
LPSPQASFNDVPADVLALILAKALSATPAPSVGLGSVLKNLETRKAHVQSVSLQWTRFASVCRNMRKAAMKDVVLRSLLETASFFVPKRTWAGGNLRDAFRVQFVQLTENIEHQKQQV